MLSILNALAEEQLTHHHKNHGDKASRKENDKPPETKIKVMEYFNITQTVSIKKTIRCKKTPKGSSMSSVTKLMKREKSLPKIYLKSGKEPCRYSGDEKLNKWDEECIRKY